MEKASFLLGIFQLSPDASHPGWRLKAAGSEAICATSDIRGSPSYTGAQHCYSHTSVIRVKESRGRRPLVQVREGPERPENLPLGWFSAEGPKRQENAPVGHFQCRPGGSPGKAGRPRAAMPAQALALLPL